MPKRLNADDFITGLFAGLALAGQTTLSIRGDRFDRIMHGVFDELVERSSDADVDVRFRIRPHPVHGDSMTLRDAISAAAQRDLISLDNPEYQDIRFKFGPSDAAQILDRLPGGSELFNPLANSFLEAYYGASYAVGR